MKFYEINYDEADLFPTLYDSEPGRWLVQAENEKEAIEKHVRTFRVDLSKIKKIDVQLYIEF